MRLHCQAKEKANRVEEQLQELTAKLAAMETEKHSLATRNKVLETALATAKASPGQVCCLLLASLCPEECECTRRHLVSCVRTCAVWLMVRVRVICFFQSLVVTASAPFMALSFATLAL